MTSQIIGNCTNDSNPDSWYPTQPNGGYMPTVLARMAPDINRAISLCKSCPMQEKCLEEGMKPHNLAHGIWGGLLAGERIAIADEQGVDYLVHPNNKGRVLGPRIRNRHSGLPTGGGVGGGSAPTDEQTRITRDERNYALSFAQRIRPYLEV